MAGAGRRVRLALRAYVAGVLDFSTSRRYSPLWEIKREFVFEQLEDDNLLKIKLMRQQLHAAASAFGQAETYDHHFNKSVAEIRGVSELLFPWIDWKGDSKAQEYAAMWEDWFGIKVGSKEWEDLEREGAMMYQMYTEQGRQRVVE